MNIAFRLFRTRYFVEVSVSRMTDAIARANGALDRLEARYPTVDPDSALASVTAELSAAQQEIAVLRAFEDGYAASVEQIANRIEMVGLTPTIDPDLP